MSSEFSKQKQKLEEFCSPAFIDALTDPYHVNSIVREYYAGLNGDEKIAFEDALMSWLDIERTVLTRAEDLRLHNGISLCGKIKLTRAVGKILAIARRFAPLRDPTNVHQNDLPTLIVLNCIGNLGAILDPTAIDFLKEEASHCGDPNPTRGSLAAIESLSQIDLNAALDFLPIEIRGDMDFKERRSWVGDESREFGLICYTLIVLLSWHGRSIIPKIAQRLREIPQEQKGFALRAFKGAMQHSVLEAADGRITKAAEKTALIAQFAEGLGLAS